MFPFFFIYTEDAGHKRRGPDRQGQGCDGSKPT